MYAANDAAHEVAAIVAEGGTRDGDPRSCQRGPGPGLAGDTGLLGSAAGTGGGVAARSASGLGLSAKGTAANGIRGRGSSTASSAIAG